ncbi:MAG: oxidoreductase [Lewinellaceae bacterium]|nr:oxidoreductase [Lewinellaceae bacterium]
MKQVVLVTGASSGIGKEVARQLLQDGHTVYVAARRIDQMEDLRALGAHPLKMDITIDADIVAVVKTIEENHGGVEVLVNNAGYAIYGAMEDTEIADARRQFEVNLFGLARLTQLVLPYMRSKKQGRIINVSSMGGKIYTPLGSWYHATKHALEGWSDCLRLELAPFGIDVVIIEPGAIQSEFGDVMLQPMMARSGNSPYQHLARAVDRSVRNTYEKGDSSPAAVIARVISQAVKARRPKTRYAAGKYAKPLLFVRRYFSDRFFDWVVSTQIK